jgi:hypothetical protein
MKRLIFWLVLGIVLSGCTGVIPEVGYTAHNDNYKNFIGKRYEAITPLRILKFSGFGGECFLARPEIKADKETKKIADVPAGTIIVVDHVSRAERVEFGVTYAYIGKFETPGIFKGGFDLASFMQWRSGSGGKKGGKVKPREEKHFKEDFLGMDSNYLKELP